MPAIAADMDVPAQSCPSVKRGKHKPGCLAGQQHRVQPSQNKIQQSAVHTPPRRKVIAKHYHRRQTRTLPIVGNLRCRGIGHGQLTGCAIHSPHTVARPTAYGFSPFPARGQRRFCP